MGAAINPAYIEVIEFLAAGTTPEALIAFCPSDAAQHRVSNLIEREREGRLSEEEQQELSDFLQLGQLVIAAKAKARRKLEVGG